MLLVAAAALATAVAREFRDDSHPPFVVRGIPARIDRLRPGMMWAQTRDILGLERHWLLGGISVQPTGGSGNSRWFVEGYDVRPARIVMEPSGIPPIPTAVYRSRASIHLMFVTSPRVRPAGWHRDSARLHGATFSDDG